MLEDGVRQKYIYTNRYTNHVRIYRQIGGICGVGSGIPKLYTIHNKEMIKKC